MLRQPPIDSDMASEQRELTRRPASEFGFYLVASNRELLNHVEDLLNRRGVFGVLDSTGRVHYLVDARKGSPFATRKIMTTADRLLGRQISSQEAGRFRIRRAVEELLDRYEWNTQLRGYRLLGDILRVTAQDISLLNPISKRLYPEMARKYRLKAHQIERNVRYLLDDLARRELSGQGNQGDRLLREGETSLPVGRTIARLTEQVRAVLDKLEEEEK